MSPMEQEEKPGFRTALRAQLWKLSVTLISWLTFVLFFTLHCTYRYRYYHFAHRQTAAGQHSRGSFILTLWHEHLFASIGAHSFQGISPIISLSKDGDIVSFVATMMGMTPVRGSSSRGGRKAKVSLEEQIGGGLIGAITVDGPRGPRRLPKLGAFQVAAATKTWVLPSTAIASRYWTLKSWDQFKIPKPFATIAVVYGKPLPYDTFSSRGQLRELSGALTGALNDLDPSAVQLLKSSDMWTKRSEVLRRFREQHNG